MDQLDIAIIEYLQQDARMPLTDIAKALGVVEGTVRNRVAKLVDSQLLRLNATVDPHRAGFNSPAFIFISVKPGSLEAVAEKLATIPEVSYLVAITGNADLLVEVMCADSEHLMNVLVEHIHTVGDIVDTRTSTILRVYKELIPSLSIIMGDD